jgi:signal transduction histidine kinase
MRLYPELTRIREKFGKMCQDKMIAFSFPLKEEMEQTTVHSDPEILRKIIHHLLDNAVKFTTQGTINATCNIEGDQFEFIVTDTGRGINPEMLSTIFDNFVQEDVSLVRGHEGSGLGLSIVKGMVSLLGGSIHVDSVKGHGTTFKVLIPV